MLSSILGNFLTPSAATWQTAAEALDSGDAGPMRELLAGADKPLELAELFALCLASAAECRNTMAAYDGTSPHASDTELALLRQSSPATVKDAEKIAARIAELESSKARTMHLASQAEMAGKHLAAVQSFAPELFGLAPRKMPDNVSLPPRVGEWLYRHVGRTPDSWAEIVRQSDPKAKRRKIVAASF